MGLFSRVSLFGPRIVGGGGKLIGMSTLLQTTNNIRTFTQISSSSVLRKSSDGTATSTKSTSDSSNDTTNVDVLQQEQQFTKQILRRALLYVPGNDQRKIDKVKPLLPDIDTVVFDCEDGVAINRKEDARNTILSTLNQFCPIDPSTSKSNEDPLLERISVRINSVDSGLAEDDLKVILSGRIIPRTLLLPKVESKEHIDWFLDKLSKALKKRPKTDEPSDLTIDLVIYVESAKGLLDLRDICQHSIEMYEYAPIQLAAIVFGSDDFCANIGATRTDNGHEVSMARQQVVTIAKAYDLQAIDSVYINFKDLVGLEEQSREGASIGFTGKQAIHPSQIEVIQRAFSPSEEKIAWARGLIDAFHQAQLEGRGAFVYQGQMIDMPLLRQAHNILQFEQNPPVKHKKDKE